MDALTPEQTDDLFALLAPELQERVRLGEVRIVAPGKNEKPVVIDAAGHPVKGSGQYLAAPDAGYVSKTTAYKRSKAYNEAITQMVGAWKNDETLPDAILSLEELISAAKRLAVPEPVTQIVEHECSECGHQDSVAFRTDAKPDQKMLAFLIERLAGAAAKTENINIQSEEMIRIMSDQHVLHEVTFVGLTAEQRAERARQIMDA